MEERSSPVGACHSSMVFAELTLFVVLRAARERL